jgi:hypothetical protein
VKQARDLSLCVAVAVVGILLGFCAQGAERDLLWAADSLPAPDSLSLQRIPCGGVDRTLLAPLETYDYYAQDFGILALRVRRVHPREDFDYVVELLDEILPAMVEVVGAPASYETLTVEFTTRTIADYWCWAHMIRMPSLHRRGLPLGSSGWDNTFIHELVHAFQRDLSCGDPYPSWVEEGIAEAGCYFVSELATERSAVRDFRYVRFDEEMAIGDLLNSAGSQVFGGCRDLIDRADAEMAYESAAVTILIPALAEIGAGRSSPHPLARLTETLREELQSDGPHRLYRAIDRAWTTPVDGVSPPSRWVRSRAVTCPSARAGEFLALVPLVIYSGVNARSVYALHLQRVMGFELHLDTDSGHPARYTGVKGDRYEGLATFNTRETPADLPPGAYLVETDELGENEEILSARTWILMLSPFWPKRTLWEGIAAVFVDSRGYPVDVPDLSVNGEMLARVPGGVIAKPYSSCGGDLVFRGLGREIGTVTVAGGLPRMVVLQVDQASRDIPLGGAVSWWPYRPVAGGTVEVKLRWSESSLAATDSSITAILTDCAGQALDSVQMDPGENDDLLTAVLSVPEDLTCGNLEFAGAESHHRTCSSFRYTTLAGYDFEPLPTGRHDLSGVRMDGTDLVLTLETSADPSGLSLRLAEDPGGTRTDRGSPVPDGAVASTYRWDLADWSGAFYFEIWVGEGEDSEVLCTGFIDAVPEFPATALHKPFPNPSPGQIRLRLDVAAPAAGEVSFDIFDATGRLVCSQRMQALGPGPQELWWDGWVGERRAPPGVYFLRVDGAGISQSAKAVIVR